EARGNRSQIKRLSTLMCPSEQLSRRTHASVRHPAPVQPDGHPSRQLHDGHRIAAELVRVEDDQVAAIQLAVIAQREQPSVILGGVWGLRHEYGLAGHVA